MSPIVKWAGGKTHLLPYLTALVPEFAGTYYEPFVGGGAMFFWISRHVTDDCVISDANAALIQTYLAVQDSVEPLTFVLTMLHNVYNRLPTMEAKKDLYYYMRQRYNDTYGRFIFLNKTCYNGLYRVNSDNKFNTPFGYRSRPQICDEEGLHMASLALQEATIHADYDDMHFTPDSFIYVDPPYKGSFDKYVSDGFDHDRFKEWAERIGSRHKVMISYSDDEFSGYNKHEFSGIRSMGRERTTEYVYTSY